MFKNVKYVIPAYEIEISTDSTTQYLLLAGAPIWVC